MRVFRVKFLVKNIFKKNFKITDFRTLGLQMHIHCSAREHCGGLQTLLFYLLGSWHLQKNMKAIYNNHRSPGGDPQLKQIREIVKWVNFAFRLPCL